MSTSTCSSLRVRIRLGCDTGGFPRISSRVPGLAAEWIAEDIPIQSKHNDHRIRKTRDGLFSGASCACVVNTHVDRRRSEVRDGGGCCVQIITEGIGRHTSVAICAAYFRR